MIAGFVLSAFLQLSLLSGEVYLPRDEVLLRDVMVLPPQAITLQMQAERKIGPFQLNLHGLSSTYLIIYSMDNALPFSLTWSVGASLSYGIIDIGYDRTCYHPFSPYALEKKNNALRMFSSSTEGYSRELYIRFNIK